MRPNQRKRIQFIWGFTLIELMVVIAIVSILAAIALPSYLDYIRKSRRADGISALMAIHLNQQKWRANHTTYTSTLSDVWESGTTNSSDGHYTLSTAADGTNPETKYTITAAPQGDQTNDPCVNFVLTVAGGTATKTISGSALTADRCWAH